MSQDLQKFYEAALTAGAILSGFIGTFLSFRIQREASYFRFPGGRNRNQQHFTSSLFLIIVSAISSVLFGVLLPLFALAQGDHFAVSAATILAGIIGSLVVVGAYFFDELFHYRILFKADPEWKNEIWIVVGGILLASCAFTMTFCIVHLHT